MKNVFIFLILTIFLTVISSNEQTIISTEEFVKRTVLILPFINKNKVEKYDYLSDTLMDALKANLMNTGQFNLSNPVQLDINLNKLGITEANILKPSKTIDIARKLSSDVVLSGKYIIIDDKIMIQVQAVDVFTGDIVIIENSTSQLGINLLILIDELSKNLTKKLVEKLPMVKKTYFKEMSQVIKDRWALNSQINMTTLNKTGLGLICGGSALFLIGLPFLFYDIVYYSNTLINNKIHYEKTNEGFDEFNNSYKIFVGIFAAGIAVSSLGLIAGITGVPLLIYKDKNKKLTINFNCSDNIKLFISFKL